MSRTTKQNFPKRRDRDLSPKRLLVSTIIGFVVLAAIVVRNLFLGTIDIAANLLMKNSSRTLVTGFTAFGRFDINPSAILASECGRPFRLIEVSYAAADGFVATLDPHSFDRLLMLGVAGNSSAFRVERLARNVIGATPDVRGVVPESRVIDVAGPATIGATLWLGSALPAGAQFSDDAGGYLCNYLMYRALSRLAETMQVGFLHVPPVEAMAIGEQNIVLQNVLEWVEAGRQEIASNAADKLVANGPRMSNLPLL